MAEWTDPAPEDFVDRYVEFVSYDYDWVAVTLAEAVDEVGATWIEDDRLEAIYALTAHRLSSASGGSSSGAGTSSETVGPLTVASAGGQIIQETVGPLTVRYAPPEKGTQWGFTTTKYGALYEMLLKRSHPAVAIV